MEEFAFRLHRRLAEEGDLVWSPYSVVTVLALVAAGARGTTRDEVVRVLGGPPERLRLAEAADLEDADIAVAATLWARQGLAFEDAYRSAVAAFPGGAVHSADFARDPEGARQAINTDVRKTTHDLIKDLLPPGSVTTDMTAAVVSALYLRTAWYQPFDRDQTRPGRFHGAGGPREVPMMRQTERLPYAEAGGWRMVSLSAHGGLAVDVLLGEDGPPPVERLRSLAAPTRVALTMPRFRVESRAGLVQPLRAAGVVEAFGDRADFSAMTRSPVRLDRVEHMAVLDVDENGFEGAAATAATMVLMGMPLGRPVEFRVDRPFVVVVRHPRTGAIFFLARVTEPG